MRKSVVFDSLHLNLDVEVQGHSWIEYSSRTKSDRHILLDGDSYIANRGNLLDMYDFDID